MGSSFIAAGPLTRLIYNQCRLIDEAGKYRANHGKNVVGLTGPWREMRADEFACVGLRKWVGGVGWGGGMCHFDLLNGPALRQLPRCDGDRHKLQTHKHKHRDARAGPD